MRLSPLPDVNDSGGNSEAEANFDNFSTPVPGFPADSTKLPCGLRYSQLLQVGILSVIILFFAIFVVGVIGKSSVIMRQNGWDEVFTVIGMCSFFFIFIVIYRTISCLQLTSRIFTEKRLFYILQVLLLLTHILQQCVFMVYLAEYVSKLCLIFLLADVIIAASMLTVERLRGAQHWPLLYVVVQAGKLAVFWSTVGKPLPAEGRLRFDGMLGVLMLTILVVQLPVLMSRLRAGMSLTRAYTSNMAAAYAHVLHLMDVLELYLSVMEMNQVVSDTKLLVFFFAITGFVTSNIYYAALFLNNVTTMRIVCRFQELGLQANDLVAPTKPAKDEKLLHYFLWTFLFIDLPYAVMRVVSFVVDRSGVSVFLAKNLFMAFVIVMLLVQNSK